LRDAAVPVSVEITGWSPFTPPDADPSSLPAGELECITRPLFVRLWFWCVRQAVSRATPLLSVHPKSGAARRLSPQKDTQSMRQNVFNMPKLRLTSMAIEA